MAEYIGKQKAIKAIENLQDCYNGFSDTYDKACIIGILEEVPTADVAERKHGVWIPLSRCDRCSLCGWETGRYVNASNYCPNCGADMRGET